MAKHKNVAQVREDQELDILEKSLTSASETNVSVSIEDMP